ncbi:hypothetical protein EDD16DRAFT_892167 [Pisolithus croceorrhizus]|nr:hypothetical protein EDD16DRAFT_892167 [Pisolithus croceorrhizus]
MERGAIKFFSEIFGLDILKDYVGEITFFKEFRSMMSIAGSGGGLSARPLTSLGTPSKSRVGQNPRTGKAAPPLVKKCRALGPLADFHQYVVARRQVRREVKSISQTLSVGLLEHIHTAILDASEDKTRGIRDTTDARRVDIHSTVQEIRALQTSLDATDDDDEQRAFEEDVTGKILWISWCGILSEVEQLLAEVVNYIRRERDSMTPEGVDRFRQGLLEIGDIILKATHHHDHDDDLTHLQRIMVDAGAGVSRQQLWLAARIPEQTSQPSIPVGRRVCSASEKSK